MYDAKQKFKDVESDHGSLINIYDFWKSKYHKSI